MARQNSVIEDVIPVLERPDLHYEAILGYVETQFRRQRSLAQDYHGFYSWLVELVYMLLYYRQVNNNAFFANSLPFYDGLRGLVIENEPLWVFFLNHDLIVEMIVARLGLPLYCGFSSKTVALPRRNARGEKTGEIRAEVLTKHELEHAAMYFPNPFKPGIYLHKLHGSLDIFTFNNGDDLLRLLPDGKGVEAVSRVLRAANEELLYLLPGAPGGKAKALNEIAYADETGEMQFLRRTLLAGAYKFDEVKAQTLPKSTFRHFGANINFVTTLVCIGYGFGDLHINSVLAKWLEFSAARRLEIVSPQANGVPSFLLHVAPQVSVVQSTCTDYLDKRGGIARSKGEILQKRIGVVSRRVGHTRAKAAIQAFLSRNQERIRQAFIAKLEGLPKKDGRPDFDSVSDPATLGQKWASELQVNKDETLTGLLAHLETIGDQER